MEIEQIKEIALRFLAQTKQHKKDHTNLVPMYVAMVDGAGRPRLSKGLNFSDVPGKHAAQDWVNEQARKMKPMLVLVAADSYLRDPKTMKVVGEQVMVNVFGPGVSFMACCKYTYDLKEIVFEKDEIIGLGEGEVLQNWIQPWWESGIADA